METAGCSLVSRSGRLYMADCAGSTLRFQTLLKCVQLYSAWLLYLRSYNIDARHLYAARPSIMNVLMPVSFEPPLDAIHGPIDLVCRYAIVSLVWMYAEPEPCILNIFPVIMLVLL